jgi:hypothetical protein
MYRRYRKLQPISVRSSVFFPDRVLAQFPCASVALFYLSLRRSVCSILNSRSWRPSFVPADISYLARQRGRPLGPAINE